MIYFYYTTFLSISKCSWIKNGYCDRKFLTGKNWANRSRFRVGLGLGYYPAQNRLKKCWFYGVFSRLFAQLHFSYATLCKSAVRRRRYHRLPAASGEYDDFFRATGYIINQPQDSEAIASVLPVCDSDECCKKYILHKKFVRSWKVFFVAKNSDFFLKNSWLWVNFKVYMIMVGTVPHTAYPARGKEVKPYGNEHYPVYELIRYSYHFCVPCSA